MCLCLRAVCFSGAFDVCLFDTCGAGESDEWIRLNIKLTTKVFESISINI